GVRVARPRLVAAREAPRRVARGAAARMDWRALRVSRAPRARDSAAAHAAAPAALRRRLDPRRGAGRGALRAALCAAAARSRARGALPGRVRAPGRERLRALAGRAGHRLRGEGSGADLGGAREAPALRRRQLRGLAATRAAPLPALAGHEPRSAPRRRQVSSADARPMRRGGPARRAVLHVRPRAALRRRAARARLGEPAPLRERGPAPPGGPLTGGPP